jgi:acyl-CoA dehydrogenase
MGRAQPWVSGASELDPALLSAVRAFSRRHQDAVTLDRAGLLPVSLLDDARALGLFGLAIPVRFGGLGLGLGPTAAVVAELARADRSVATTVGLHNGLGSRALLAGADPGLLERYAPQLANGTRVGAFAATEPGAGSDLGAIRTTTRRDSAGLRISGEKAYVTNAGFAGLFTVLCRTPDGEGAHSSALVVVPGEAPGVSLGREELKMGLRASSTRALHLDDVWVPNDHRLGASERGTVEAHRALEWGRSLMAAGCLGTAKEALARTLAYASERTQFRRRLRAFGAVRSHLVVMATSVVTLEALLSRVAGDEQCGLPLESSSAALKVMASELAFDAADRAVQGPRRPWLRRGRRHCSSPARRARDPHLRGGQRCAARSPGERAARGQGASPPRGAGGRDERGMCPPRRHGSRVSQGAWCSGREPSTAADCPRPGRRSPLCRACVLVPRPPARRSRGRRHPGQSTLGRTRAHVARRGMHRSTRRSRRRGVARLPRR